MSKFWQILKVTGVLAGVVVLGVLVGWLVTRNGQSPNQPRKSETTTERVEHWVPDNPLPGASNNVATISPPTNSLPPPPPRPPGTNNLITNYDELLDKILGGDEDASAKAKQLLAIFPRLPEEGQTDFAQHLANLTDDKDFPTTLAPYLTATNTPGSVLDILLADLLNRPNTVKLPILLDVARSCPDQKAAGEAKEILTLFLDEDHGSDWTAWDTKLKQWLADNPD